MSNTLHLTFQNKLNSIMRHSFPSEQPQSWRTTPYWLYANADDIYCQLCATSKILSPVPTICGQAMTCTVRNFKWLWYHTATCTQQCY